MVIAYVMVKAYTGEADRLKREIEAVPGVVSAHIVAGDVDVIARVEVDSPADVRQVAAADIQNIDGVEDTTTYIAME
jgi:DNA-binding Lrp family transcriptional regulator